MKGGQMRSAEQLKVDRRTFLKGVGVTAAGVTAAAATGALAPRAIAATSGSPVTGLHIPNNLIGFQMYNVRDAFMAQPEATIQALAQAGYYEVEFAGLPGVGEGPAPAEARVIRGLLDKYGLKAISSHHDFSMIQTKDQVAGLIETARILGQHYIVIPGGVPNTAEGFAMAGAVFNRAGAQFRAGGLTLAYHNHTEEFTNHAPDGRTFYQVLLDNSDPHLLHMELDMGWANIAGLSVQDMIALMEANKNRIVLGHVKDHDAAGNLVDLGTGIEDYKDLLGAATVLGMRQFIIENDDLNFEDNQFTRAANMREYLATLKLTVFQP